MDPVGGTATPSLETSEVGFFALDDLPPLSEGRTLLEDIREANAAHLDANLAPI